MIEYCAIYVCVSFCIHKRFRNMKNYLILSILYTIFICSTTEFNALQMCAMCHFCAIIFILKICFSFLYFDCHLDLADLIILNCVCV